MTNRAFVWCTYRQWSFDVLEGLLDVPGWRCDLIITTEQCKSDLSGFERCGVQILRTDPKTTFLPDQEGLIRVSELQPNAVFHYGWSWFVPKAVRAICPNVTLHPGRLPQGRGGSPIQNQIRQGWDWTEANIIELVDGMDEGDIYSSLRISLEGQEADAIWSRMTSAGIVLSRKLLLDLARGQLTGRQQDGEPSVFKRVKKEASRLSPDHMSARQIYDIVRGHNETDLNSYVARAWMPLLKRDLVIERASLEKPGGRRLIELDELNQMTDAPFALCHAVNEGDMTVRIEGADGNPVFATRVRLRAAATRQNEN